LFLGRESGRGSSPRDIPNRMNISKRIGLLRRRMSGSGLQGLLVTHLPDVRYLCGFTGSSAALAITRRGFRMFTDGRYTAQAAEEVSGAKVEIVPSAPAIAAVQWLAVQVAEASSGAKAPRDSASLTRGLKPPTPSVTGLVAPSRNRLTRPLAELPAVSSQDAAVGFDSAHTSVAELERFRAALPARLRRKLLTPLTSLVEPLRWLKDEDELAVMAEAAKLGDDLFTHMLGFIRPGQTETEVAAELEYQARVRGAEGMSFDSIVASGFRSALPHGRASQAKLPRHGLLTLDFGVILKGYCSDMTRTVCLGKPTAREREVYEAVLEAQEAAVAAVVAGAECGVVDEAARSVLRRAGMAEAFSHSTGHGVGLEIHEGPRIGAGQKNKLDPGMVITIEPGVYFAGEFGVRIEDMVAVTRTGGTVLTHSPKALIEL
jgi:Xaa-Pro aminopeptidase